MIMQANKIRETLSTLETVRRQFLVSRLGKAGLADMEELDDAIFSDLGSLWKDMRDNPGEESEAKFWKYMDSIEPDEPDDFDTVEGLLSADLGAAQMVNLQEPYKRADQAFVNRLHEHFEPVDGIYKLFDVTDETFALYCYSDRRQPDDIGNIMEVIGYYLDDDGTYRSRKEILDSSKGGRPTVTRMNLTTEERVILDRGVKQLREVATIIKSETDGTFRTSGESDEQR